MNQASTHIIKRTVLDFQFNGITDGFSFQQEVKDWFYEFIQQLTAKLDEVAPANIVLSIDKMELDIELGESDWKQQASQKITEQLNDKIQLIQSGAISSYGYKEQTSDQHFANTFLFYLQHGYLQWNAAGISIEKWNIQLEKLFLQADENFANALKEIVGSSAAARERLMQLIPFQSTVELFNSYNEQRPAIHLKLIHDLQLLMKIAIVHNYYYMRQVVYKAFLLNLSPTADPVQIKQELAQSIHKKALIDPSVIDVVAELQFQSKRLLALQTELSAEKKSTRYKNEARKFRIQKLIQQEQDLLDMQEMQQLLSDPVYISNAGLVIVAAFLPAFFEKVKLASNHIISDQQKATCLLQYLVAGSDKLQEYELVLPKILCGLPITKPVHTGSFHMNKVLRKEADDVLLSVIEHWNILQNTSVEGLRLSFLQRNGKLSYNGSEWLLQVEQQPYDMLLQHLPWNISMIKLPWMEQMLKTEWIH